MENETYTQPQAQDTSSKGSGKKKVKVVTVLLVVIILILVGLSAFLYYQVRMNQLELSKVKDPQYLQQLQQDSVQATKDKVSKLIVLPEGDPTVATITDAEALKKDNPEFYKDAQNGDTLLIFQKKAILYRESTNIIVNVAPVFLEPTNETQQSSGSTEEAQ